MIPLGRKDRGQKISALLLYFRSPLWRYSKGHVMQIIEILQLHLFDVKISQFRLYLGEATTLKLKKNLPNCS